MNLSFALARRLYKNEGKGKHSSLPAVRIAIISVALGTAVMLLSVAVAFGFSDSISTKVTSLGSDIVVSSSENTTASMSVAAGFEASPALISSLKKSCNADHISSVAVCQGVLKTNSAFAPLTFKGLGQDYDVSFLSSSLVEGRLPRFSNKNATEILLSKSVCKTLSLKTGDKVYAYFFTDKGLLTRRFLITGVYATQISMFDDNLVFAPISTVRKLCGYAPDAVSSLEITLSHPDSLDIASLSASKVVARYNIDHDTSLTAIDIHHLYPQIFSWLSLLKVNIAVILIIMLLVSGVTMVTSLLIIILERTSTIALLSALGAGRRLLGRTFLSLSLMILLRGMFWGNVIALALCFIQKEFNIFPLNPESYYLDAVPVELSVPAFLAINALIFFVCTCTLYFPSRLVSSVRPMDVLRHG